MSENTVKHEHKQCGGKNIEKMEENRENNAR